MALNKHKTFTNKIPLKCRQEVKFEMRKHTFANALYYRRLYDDKIDHCISRKQTNTNNPWFSCLNHTGEIKALVNGTYLTGVRTGAIGG